MAHAGVSTRRRTEREEMKMISRIAIASPVTAAGAQEDLAP
jgi:hypothetical protein